MDILTLLLNASIKEIQEAEDARFFEELKEISWLHSDKCKGNILRHDRSYRTRLKVFLWFQDWATTRKKDELHSSL